VGPAAPRASLLQRPGAAAAVIGLAALTLILAWLIWQPLRSADALSASLSAAARGDTVEAVTQARDAASIDPVSIEPLQILSSLYIGAHDLTAAREQFVKATQRQPDNPESWLGLGNFELQQGQTRAAYRSLLRAIRLNPLDPTATALVLKARTDLGFPPPAG
jgi:cytochrome c-type biogenesis protein CcmH/NrfG